jgi:hypothetical protein
MISIVSWTQQGAAEEMNVQSGVDQAGRLIEDLHRQASAYFAGNSDIEEPAPGELWERAVPDLEKALAILDKKESPDTPEFSWNPLRKARTILDKKDSPEAPEYSWNPLRKSKAGFQRDLDAILDAVLVILGTCGAAGYRTRIRNLEADIATSQARIGTYREQMLSAPAESSQNFITTMVVSSRESLTDQIADESDRITGRKQQIENLKAGFREHLQHIGINVSPDTADTFLLPVEDNIVSMAAVISNIGGLTEQLQHLVDESKEAPPETKRYYGMYVLLVFAVDRIQTHFVKEIDETFIPRLDGYEEDASRHIASAKSQVSDGGPREQLEANIAANGRTIDACRLMAETLQSHRRSVLDENRKVQILEAAAVNSYRTVCLSFNVAELIGYCEAAFRALRELRLPPLRTYQNVQLNEEMQKLAERVVEKE